MGEADDFGARVAKARGRMSQPVLAGHLGMSVSKLKRIEAGKELPDFERKGIALTLIEVADVPPDVFAAELGPRFSEPNATARLADLEDRLEATNSALRDLAARQLDADEEAEWQKYLSNGSRSSTPGHGAASE